MDVSAGEALPQKAPSLFVVDAGALPVPLAVYLRSVRLAFGEVPIVAVGKSLSDEDLCRLLFLGTDGFVPYNEVEEQLSTAVNSVLGGKVWAPLRVVNRYIKVWSRRSALKEGGCGPLTARESTILGLLERRLSNKEIGSALGISERTVRFHLENVFAKLGVHDRHSAADLARIVDACAWRAVRERRLTVAECAPRRLDQLAKSTAD